MSKNGTSEYWLRRNFKEVLSLPDNACDWLIDFWNVIQVFDDVVDGDDIDRDDADRAIWSAIVGLPQNGFFQEYSTILLPLMASLVLKWKASDTVERNGEACAMSFVWRAGYYDLVLAAVHLCHGPEVAMDIGHAVITLYGESLEDYMKEMRNA